MPTYLEINAVSISIYCNKQPIPNTFQILNVFISTAINETPAAKLVMLDDGGPSENFPASSSTVFDIGNEVEIRAGYDVTNETIFQGVISKHSIKINVDSGPELIVDIKGVAEKTEIKDVSTILQQSEAEPILEVTYGVNIFEFVGEIHDGRDPINPISSDFDTQGYVKIQGNTKLHIGSIIGLSGVGNRLSGRAWIYGVKHLIADGKWTTEVKFYKHANSSVKKHL